MRRHSRRTVLLASVSILFLIGTSGFGGEGQVEDLAPKEVYKMLTRNAQAVLIDVRSRAEYEFVGHPPMAYNIPFMFWNPKDYGFQPNPAFKKDLSERFGKDIPVLFMCRSGGRSAKAAQMAVSLGFKEVYNVVEGFEGSKDGEGHRTVNGWKNSGLPYTFKVADELKY